MMMLMMVMMMRMRRRMMIVMTMCSLVTEAWVQAGETALWSKWDTSTTCHSHHHLDDHDHDQDDADDDHDDDNDGDNQSRSTTFCAGSWLMQWIKILLILKVVPCENINKIAFSIWQHPSFPILHRNRKKVGSYLPANILPQPGKSGVSFSEWTTRFLPFFSPDLNNQN